MPTITPTATTPTAQPPQPAAPSAPAAASAPQEFTQFISLLTAQVQNQDPLKPLDATAFTEQLATFSALEQQVQTNKHLEKMISLLSSAE